MLDATLAKRFIELFEQLALVLGEFNGRLYRDVAIQVAIETRSNAFDALAPQSKLLSRLCAFRNVNGRFPLKGGDLNLSAQSRNGKSDGHGAMQVVPVALEDVVLVDSNLNVQVTRWSAIGTRLTVARAPEGKFAAH